MGMYGKLAAVESDAIAAMGDWGYDEMMPILEAPGSVDLDKRWDVVFRLIGHIAGTGLMMADNAQPVGEELVHGPAMYIDSDTVKIMSMQLGAVDNDQIAAAWAQVGIEDTYPVGVAIEQPEWFLDGFTQTVELIVDAAESNRVLVFAVT